MVESHIEFLVEEPSMEAFLEVFIRRWFPDCSFAITHFRDKMRFYGALERVLIGYASWIGSDFRIVILMDRNSDDCKALKEYLEACAARAGLRTRRTSPDDWQVATCIVIEELEAWYFGDWEAVCAAYPRAPKDIPGKSRYRNPDAIHGGTAEAFERVLQRVGYYAAGLAKVDAARRVGAHFDPARCRSQSFRYFYAILLDVCRLAGDAATAQGHP